MEQRRGGERHVAGEDIEIVHRIDVVPPKIAVGQHGALGPPRGARRVHDHRDLVRVHADRVRRHAPAVVDGLPAVRLFLCQEVAYRRQIGARPIDQASMPDIGDQHAGIRVADVRGLLGPGQTEVQRHKGRTQARACEQGEQEHRMIEAEESHPVAASHPEPMQPAGELLDLLLHLSVVPGSVFECERGALRGTQRALEEPVGQADVGGAHELRPRGG